MSQNNIFSSKQEARKVSQEKMASLSDGFTSFASKHFTDFLLTLPIVQSANTIFCYVSVQNEPGTLPFIEYCLSVNKRIFVPKCLPNREMEAVQIHSLAELFTGYYGLLEPSENSPICLPEDLDLVVAPCLSCDATGIRLGHGGGYYDRYLAKVNCPIICLCYEALLQKHLPSNAFDIPVDLVITEKRVLEI